MQAFHLCLSTDTVENDRELLNIAQRSGITDVWVTGFLYGYWHYPLEQIRRARAIVEQAGMASHVVNVPLGHPGDSLGAKSGDVPLTPPQHWRLAQRPDGSAYAGTSLHAPATEENAQAMRALATLGVDRVCVDDDFRLATSPGTIGGCFCAEHRRAFLDPRGYGDRQWDELLAAVQDRRLSPLLREWINFTCDELSASFRAQQSAAPQTQLGIMVMYLGAEKAGIRLADYAGAPLRVGEFMFDDDSFGAVKGKTDELFSALFHRRYVAPELAYSETTAFPSDRLSARNMAAKLNVPLLADVRNVMFMSGLTPFPRSHWETLAPALQRHAGLHAVTAGHTPRGPFKHFWGEHSRCVGDDNPYSLFLATGIPFQVVSEPPADGWVFLGDADTRALAQGELRSAGCAFVTRAQVEGSRAIAETLPALFALKHELLPHLRDTPFVVEDVPAVIAWYPEARAALLWNLSEHGQILTVQFNHMSRRVEVPALEATLINDLG
jgi:hypothetical protein